MKIVFIQLAHETGKVAVLEVFGEDGLGEFLALDRRVSAVRGDRTPDHGNITSSTTKLSPSSPQRTIDA